VPGNLRDLGERSKSIGKLVLDASFSPVRRVSYSSRALVSSSVPTSTS
jgi:DNA-directed RNA polymerase alpha subunit